MLICIFEAIKPQKQIQCQNLQSIDSPSVQGFCNKIEIFLKK